MMRDASRSFLSAKTTPVRRRSIATKCSKRISGRCQSRTYFHIDEIDSLLSLNFPVSDFFTWIRYCYNQQAHDPNFQRLGFTLFGVAIPSDLISDKRRTPFNNRAIRTKSNRVN